MALRVHKLLGYGLVNLIPNDPRLNTEGFFASKDPIEDFHLGKFFKYLQETDAEKWRVELFSIAYDFPHLLDCIYKGKIGNKEILCICPPNKAMVWHRFDDVIDYVEESEIHGQTNWYKVFSSGLPSCRYYMDKRTGVKLSTPSSLDFLKTVSLYTSPQRRNSEKLTDEAALSSLASELGFANVNEAVENVVPFVPPVMVEFCKFLSIFNDEQTVLDLKPMLCVYWI
jgi:hypothetical protein